MPEPFPAGLAGPIGPLVRLAVGLEPRADLARDPLALADAPVEGRLEHPALGRRRGGSAGVAPEQPLARALRRRQAPSRQGQSGQGRCRAQGADRRLAHPRARGALPTGRPARPGLCPGKLLHSSGRLRPTNELRSRGSCNRPHATSAERELSIPLARTGRSAYRSRPLTSRSSSKRRVAGRPPLPQPALHGAVGGRRPRALRARRRRPASSSRSAGRRREVHHLTGLDSRAAGP